MRALPCQSHRPALPIALPCWLLRRPATACRIALPCSRVALLAAALPYPACASPCPAHAEPSCCPHRPAAGRPAAAHPASPSPSGRRPAARVPPCWHLNRCPHRPAYATLLLPALLRAALLADALLPARRPAARAPPCWQWHHPALPTRSPAGPPPCLRAALLVARHPALPAMASLCVLTFDHGGRSIQFDMWLDDLQLYLLSDSRDSVSLFDHTSRASLAPPATADSATRSQWLTRDAAARLAIRNHLPLAKRAYFGQHKTAKALYDGVVARYSSPTTTTLDRLILPYLFPELSAFATVQDLVTNLRTSNTRYRAALPTEFLHRNPPRMYITLYFIVTRLPDSLRAVRDNFLALDPTDLTVDLLEKHLLAAETSVVAVGTARGTPRTPFFEGCSPSSLAPSYASATAVDILGADDVGAASALSGKRRSSKGKGGKSGGGGSGGGGGGGSGGNGGGGGGGSGGSGRGSGGFGGGSGGSGGGGGGGGGGSESGGGGSGGGRGGAVQQGGSGGGQRQQQQRRSETPTPKQLREWFAQRGAAEGDCYLCVPPNPGIEAAALGASESALPGTAPAEALHTFTLDLGASRCFYRDSTTLTPLSAPIPVRLADPSGGPVLASSFTFLPCPAVLSGSLSGLHLPWFSTNLPPARVASCRTRLSFCTTAMVTPPCHAFVACTPASLSPVFPGLGLPSRPRLPRPAFLASRGGSAPLLNPPRFRKRLLPYRLSIWTVAPTLRLHFNRGGEFSSNLLRDFFRGEGILQSFTLPAFLQQNRFAEHRIGLVMEVARTSMIHAAAPHFLWSFTVRYAAHQLNLWPRVSLPETSPSVRWTGKVGDASVFRDVTFDESVPFYHLFPYRSTPLPLPPLFLALGPPLTQVLLEVLNLGVLHLGGAEPASAEPGGAELEGAKPGVTHSEGAESGGAEPRGTACAGGPAGAGACAAGGTGAGGSGAACPGGARTSGIRAAGAGGVGGDGFGDPGAVGTGGGDLGAGGTSAGGARAGATGDGGAGASSPGGAGVTAGAGGPIGAGASSPGGARTRGTGAAGAGGTGAGGAGSGVTGAGGAGAGGAGAGDPGAGCAGAGGAGARGPGAGGTLQRRPFFVAPQPSSLSPPDSPHSPLLAPSFYAEHTHSLTERHEPESRPASPVCGFRTGFRVPRPRPPPVPGTHIMALRPSSIPLRDPMPPTIPRLLATVVTNPLFESTATFALFSELVDFAAACRLDYATSLVAESESDCPPSIGGECALGTNVLEDRQEDLECLAAAVPHLEAMLLAPEGDPDAPDIPTPRSYAEAITDPYSSHSPSGANIVDGMWNFRVKRPPGSSPVFKARYVAQGFSQRQGVHFFHTFSPTLKMATLWVLLHVAAQRDYELHSLDFSTAFLQGSLHEETWLRRPPSFTGSFPAGTQWSLRRPVYGLRQVPREWHIKLMTTLAALGFAPSIADLTLFLRTDTSLPPFYVLKRHTCTNLGELSNYLSLQITPDRARCTITLTQSHMVHQVLQRFGFRYSSPLSTPLPTGHSLSDPPSDESVEPSGPYPELVGYLMYLMTCTRPNLAYPLSILARYVAPERHRPEHWEVAKRVLRNLCSTSGMGLVLGGRGLVVLTRHEDASWTQITSRVHLNLPSQVRHDCVARPPAPSRKATSALGGSPRAELSPAARVRVQHAQLGDQTQIPFDPVPTPPLSPFPVAVIVLRDLCPPHPIAMAAMAGSEMHQTLQAAALPLSFLVMSSVLPVVKVLLIAATGLIFALPFFDVLHADARKSLSKVRRAPEPQKFAPRARASKGKGCGAEGKGCGAEGKGCGAEGKGCGAEGKGCGAEGKGCVAEGKGCVAEGKG
ncbi:unnamed protein product, partial [Closterium sp. NIES-54]